MIVGCCTDVTAVLWYLGYQRHETGEVLSWTNYYGIVNVSAAADTDWESTCRVNKSQYAHRVSDIF